MKIDREELARAVRTADEEVELTGLPAWLKKYDIEADGFVYVAKQRALRAGMVLDGKPPAPTTHTTVVRLSQRAQELQTHFASIWMDGFCAGFRTLGFRRSSVVPDGGLRHAQIPPDERHPRRSR